jgi:hypothetical protein
MSAPQYLTTIDATTDLTLLPYPRDRKGVLLKKGRGQTLSFYQPWRSRYFKLSVKEGTLTYFATGDK